MLNFDQFTDEVLESCTQNLNEINKAMVESCAQVAYNDVIFESAVLMEADEEAKDAKNDDPSKFKNAAFKALDNLKRIFDTIFAKIRIALNEFLAKLGEKNAAKWIETYKKDADKKELAATTILLPKYIGIEAPEKVFRTDLGVMKFQACADNDQLVNALKAEISVPGNYAAAEKALKDAKSVQEINGVLTSFVKYAAENKNDKMTFEEIFGKLPKVNSVGAKLKKDYQGHVAQIKTLISDKSKAINAATTAEQADAVKSNIVCLEKLMSFYHASFIGYIKYVAALNANVIAAIKQAKAGGVEEAAQVAEPQLETFMGLALI